MSWNRGIVEFPTFDELSDHLRSAKTANGHFLGHLRKSIRDHQKILFFPRRLDDHLKVSLYIEVIGTVQGNG